MWILLAITFGGMWCWRSIAVARVFALVLLLLDFSFHYFIFAVAKTVTPGGSPWFQPGQPVLPLQIYRVTTRFSRHRRRLHIPTC